MAFSSHSSNDTDSSDNLALDNMIEYADLYFLNRNY